MTPPNTLYHSLLRPCVLQILRAHGYHGAKTAVVDALTELAARYLSVLCRTTALHAAHNGTELAPTVLDVRMALQDCGALVPETALAEQEYTGLEDARGVEAFVAFAAGPTCREIQRIALEGDDDATDYLNALKKRHSKTDEDSKWNGTILGRGHEHGSVLVEGAEVSSLRTWHENLRRAAEKPPESTRAQNPAADPDSRPPSSGLSSLSDRVLDDDVEF